MTSKNKVVKPPKEKADKIIKVKGTTHRILKIEAAMRGESIGDLLDSTASNFSKK